MFNNIPFGNPNNCGPFGCAPSNCSPFSGFPGYNNYSPVSGWNSGSFGGFGGYNSPSFDSNQYGFGGLPFSGYNSGPGYNNYSPFNANWNTPFGGYNNWNGAGFGGHGYNNWNSMPFSGNQYNNWNHLGFGGQVNHPLSSGSHFSGMNQSVGFPGMNWNSAWMGSRAPWMNSGSYYPGNYSNQYSNQHPGSSPISGVSNWFSSPWMGYAYPGFTQQHGASSNGNVNAPVNGQYIPNGAFPFSCAPFSVPFPANSYVPAGQGVNCEAA
jgi:hypothetical protein